MVELRFTQESVLLTLQSERAESCLEPLQIFTSIINISSVTAFCLTENTNRNAEQSTADKTTVNYNPDLERLHFTKEEASVNQYV
jgi:hypothetical protein